jgi:hypothetical protein
MRMLRIVVSLILGLVVFAPSEVFAHRMDAEITFPEDDPEGIRVVAGYDTDEPAEEATVKLLDEANAVIAEAVTNERGIARLPRPGPGKYTIVVDDGIGHRFTKPIKLPLNAEAMPLGDASEPPNRWLGILAGLALIFTAFFLIWLRKAQKRPRSFSDQ